jgi:PAS domain S-box-containing protein
MTDGQLDMGDVPSGRKRAEELENLRARLAEAEEVLSAIRNGLVDAVVVSGDHGEQVYTISGADRVYRQLIETMSEGAVTLSAEGAILYSNLRAAEMLGRPLNQVFGATLRSYLPLEDQCALDALLAQARTAPSRLEINLETSDGRLLPVYLSASRLQGEGAEMVICVVLTDLTEHKSHEQIAAAERLARLILEQAAEAIVVCDEQGRVIRASEAAQRLCDGSPLLRPYAEVFPLRTGASEPFHLDAVLRGQTLRNQDAALDRQGRKFDLILNAAPLRDSLQIVGCVVTLTDNTARKEAERGLQRLNRTLRTFGAANAAVGRATTEEELLKEMCRVGVGLGGYRLAWIGFVEQDEAKTVRPVAWAGAHPEFIQTANITWADTERGRGPTGTAIRTGEAQINQDVVTNPAMAPWRAEMLRYDFKASVALPLKNNSEVFGILVFYAGEADAFGPEEVDLLKELAADLAFGIHARRDHAGREAALSTLQENLKSTVQAIATAVEMRDAYTAGHQHQVAELAVAIAREIGLTEGQIEGLFLAATIHDVGKINIPAEILSKPGKLTPLEYQLIQTHAQTGYDIIKGVNFPWPIGQIILQHHERLDGSGYPNHLKGDAILIEAKVLAVADVVDAMVSHRPYRPALGLDAALAEIEAGKGRLYDPAVADACMAIFRQKGFTFH